MWVLPIGKGAIADRFMRKAQDALGECQEVLVAGCSQGGAVAVGMGMDDVGANRDVAGNRHAATVAGRGDREVPMRQLLFFDRAADTLAEAFASGPRR